MTVICLRLPVRWSKCKMIRLERGPISLQAKYWGILRNKKTTCVWKIFSTQDLLENRGLDLGLAAQALALAKGGSSSTSAKQGDKIAVTEVRRFAGKDVLVSVFTPCHNFLTHFMVSLSFLVWCNWSPGKRVSWDWAWGDLGAGCLSRKVKS